jgi:hypothetical protein
MTGVLKVVKRVGSIRVCNHRNIAAKLRPAILGLNWGRAMISVISLSGESAVLMAERMDVLDWCVPQVATRSVTTFFNSPSNASRSSPPNAQFSMIELCRGWNHHAHLYCRRTHFRMARQWNRHPAWVPPNSTAVCPWPRPGLLLGSISYPSRRLSVNLRFSATPLCVSFLRCEKHNVVAQC